MAAAVGNQYAAKARLWTEAIFHALDRKANKDKRSRVEILADYADKLLEACDAKDLTAIQELGNRIEGRPMQRIEADTRVEIVLSYQRDPNLWQVIEQENQPTVDALIAKEPEAVQERARLLLSEVPKEQQAQVYERAIEVIRAAAARGDGEKATDEMAQREADVKPLEEGYMANLDDQTEEERMKFEDALQKVTEHNAKVRSRAGG